MDRWFGQEKDIAKLVVLECVALTRCRLWTMGYSGSEPENIHRDSAGVVWGVRLEADGHSATQSKQEIAVVMALTGSNTIQALGPAEFKLKKETMDFIITMVNRLQLLALIITQ